MLGLVRRIIRVCAKEKKTKLTFEVVSEEAGGDKGLKEKRRIEKDLLEDVVASSAGDGGGSSLSSDLLLLLLLLFARPPILRSAFFMTAELVVLSVLATSALRWVY